MHIVRDFACRCQKMKFCVHEKAKKEQCSLARLHWPGFRRKEASQDGCQRRWMSCEEASVYRV
jgi:hypothetical protein